MKGIPLKILSKYLLQIIFSLRSFQLALDEIKFKRSYKFFRKIKIIMQSKTINWYHMENFKLYGVFKLADSSNVLTVSYITNTLFLPFKHFENPRMNSIPLSVLCLWRKGIPFGISGIWLKECGKYYPIERKQKSTSHTNIIPQERKITCNHGLFSKIYMN